MQLYLKLKVLLWVDFQEGFGESECPREDREDILMELLLSMIGLAWNVKVSWV